MEAKVHIPFVSPVEYFKSKNNKQVTNMIINDLQYIESANEEVQGGSWWKRRAFNQAGADANAEAFGFNTKAFTRTNTLVIEGNFSGANSSSYSESF